MIKKIDKIIYKISAYVGAVSYVATIAMIILNLVDIVLTKFFANNVQGAYELTERLLMILVFASLAYGEMNEAHIHTTLFIAKLPRVLKFLIYGITSALAAGAAIFWAYGLRIQISETIRKNYITDVLKIPLYPFYVIALICVIIFIITLIWHTVQTFMAIKNDECANEITKTWA